MLRDLKIFRRNAGKKPNLEEIENLPINPTDSSVIQTGSDAMRPPLNTIPEPSQNPKPLPEAESGLRSKFDKTPSKVQGKGGNGTPWSLRTPEKQVGFSTRNKFGWAQKHEPSANGAETYDEGRTDTNHSSNNLPPSSRLNSFGNGGLSNMTPRSVRTMGRTTSNISECSSTQSTPTKSVTKPPNPGMSGSRPPVNVGARAGNSTTLVKGIPTSFVPSLVVNTVEVPHFELREDPSFWMDHNVQVLIRVRPLNGMERSSHGYSRCLKQESAQSIAWVGQPETRFTFDHVACETINQEMLFRVAGLPMVENCMSGYNSCMFAYGQTGSGKTYTMLGEIDELEVKPSQDRGMTPRIFEFLFARIRAEEESRRDEKLKYYCKCSFLEIYNEQITDLLDPSSTNLLLREDIKTGVYVENLTEFEVQTVNDILKLLTQGAANRKVAATNMNRESSRSHSVFTCVIESRWEKDSATNLRFARLNLVDLAGSERQKTSGAEGERLKEAANINRSLSTLGHVIMILVDVAHGKHRHIPYRDSRLTFLLQDSLGGNSKTMIIANVSPSICCAAETLSTLKFAQRAKLIQNNAVVNEDASGDVIALQHQIRLLKEELSVLKRRNVSRSLSFRSTIFGDTDGEGQDASPEEILEMDCENADDSHRAVSLGVVRVSTKQLKSLETTLAGALRREQMADTSIKQLEAEIEQLNRLVNQREEDTRCTKMMLRFREDKIQRMESLLGGFMPSDTYFLKENNALSEELQLLQARVERNPEVIRFALENIRLLDKLRRFQDFYEEGEREILLAEVSELRDQLLQFISGNTVLYNHPNPNARPQDAVPISRENDSYHFELKKTQKELEDCRNNLNSCLEINAKLTREINDLHSELNNLKSACANQDAYVEPHMESSMKEKWKHETVMKHTEEIMNLQLELDILKIILQEERQSHGATEEQASCLSSHLEMANERCLQINTQCEDANKKLKDAKSVIEALESQQILLINELEDLRDSTSQQFDLMIKQEQEISVLKEQLRSQELRHPLSLELLESGDSPLQAKLQRMQDSLEKAKRLNMWYQSDRAFQTSHEQEMDDICRQVEAETAEVIVCLQEELATLQQQVADSNAKEIETKHSLMLLETESKEMRERLYLMTLDKEWLGEQLEEKDKELRTLSEEWEKVACDIEEVISDGHEALKDASDQVDLIFCSFPQRTWIRGKLGRMIRNISEKESLIEELQKCLEEAQNIRTDMEWKLRSLRGAVLAITEVQQQERSEKEKEVLLLTSKLSERTSIIMELKNKIKLREDQIRKADITTMVAFVIVNRLSEKNSDYLDALKLKDIQLNDSIELNLKKDALLQEQVAVIEEAEKKIQSLKMELEGSEESCFKLKLKLSEEEEHICAMERKLEAVGKDVLLKTRDKLDEFKLGLSTLNLCISEYVEHAGGTDTLCTPGWNNHACVDGDSEGLTEVRSNQDISNKDSHFSGQSVLCPGWNACIDIDDGDSEGLIEIEASKQESHFVGDMTNDVIQSSFKTGKNVNVFPYKLESLESQRIPKDVCDRDLPILLLRNELESALESLRGVQAQMVKLLEEKEEISKSEKQSRKSMECLNSQVFALQEKISNTERQSDLKVMELDHKLQTVEEMAQEASSYWFQKTEVLGLELSDAKVIAAQKTAEASSLLSKFEEAQGTIKEADLMVNALMTSNEVAKLEIERLKRVESALTNERDFLFDEVRCLQYTIDQKDQQYDNLEKQFCSDLSEMRNLFIELEDIITLVQTTFKEEFKLIICDFHSLKSQLLHSTNLARSWLEDIWSEIIVKDCAMSALHLCHMGVLLEAVTGLNAENGLLLHGLCESNSVIADLREHNFKAKRELEMCRILKGKLLVDIKNSFDRILRKEDETGKLSAKLSTFEKKILDLQLQEEFMLARSNSMGSELVVLMKQLDLSNTNALTTFSNQEKLLRDKEELIKSQDEFFMIDLTAKDFESFILASELKQMSLQKADLGREQESFSAVLENIKKEVIFLRVDVELEKLLHMDTEAEVALLKKVLEETHGQRQLLLQKLKQCNLRLSEMDKVNKVLECDIQSLKEVSCSNDKLKDEFTEVKETKERLSAQVQALETEKEQLIKDLGMKETALEASFFTLQTELDRKVVELNKMSSIEEENETLKNEVMKLKGDCCRVHEDLQEKKSDFESSLSRLLVFDEENRVLKDKICYLETSIAGLHTDRDMKIAELEELRHSQTNMINALKEENGSLRRDLMSVQHNQDEIISLLSLNSKHCVDSVQAVDMIGNRIFRVLDAKSITLLDNMFQVICENEEWTSKLLAECDCLQKSANELITEKLSLQAELLRKDQVLEGMLFDLSLLQESASKAKDQKDEFLEMVANMESLEDDLALRSAELNETVMRNQMLEAQLQEKINLISALELDISKECKSLKLVMVENVELRAQMEDTLVTKSSIENDLTERSKLTERLEEELFQMDITLGQMTSFLEGLKNDMNKVTSERDHLDSVVHALKEKLEMTQTLAEENEAIAIEARQIAESRKSYADDKEEEVKLLERSVEELECTVNVLENKVDIVKGEAERQRLQREELEMELQAIRHQMMTVQSSGASMDIEFQNVKSGYADLQMRLEEREKDLLEAQKQLNFLEKYTSEKDAEISQCRAHISELNLHAEAQAHEYKQKFKALEAMAEQVKTEPPSYQVANSSSTKLEKNASKSRGSGSPFKCIGLGLAHQINLEKDEELTAGRLRIEELEALAASRQKEIFMLNARLAAAESMTHDVIRDLLGVKLDMSNYASLLDLQQVQKITENARFHNDDSLVKEEEVVKLKQQLNEFIEERQGWLEEINRRHAEMVAAQIASEKLRQRDQFLTKENEMLKLENVNHKKKVMELEDEVKKLSGQQNLHQRIHHHAKIKEENNLLKTQNEDLSAKLRRTEIILSRVKEELACYRASNGRGPSIDFDEEQRLNSKLKETEQERLQLAQKLLSLCTSILKAAGITRPVSEISPSVAEEALEQLKNQVTSLESELQDLKFKSKITSERIRLSELKQQSSPLRSRTDENCTTPFLTTLSR